MADSDVQKIYRSECLFLQEHLDMKELLPVVFTNKFISNDDYEKLKKRIENQGQISAVEYFYGVLFRKPGEENFWKFVECLQKSKQQEIADHMRDRFNEVNAQNSNVYVQLDQPGERNTVGAANPQPASTQRVQSKCDKYAYCIKYYQPDYSSTSDQEEKVACDFVSQLKRRYVEESKKINLPQKEVYDDWNEVGTNKITQVVRVVKQSHVVLLLFTRKFGQNSHNNFTSDFALYKKLDKDVVCPIGLLIGRDGIPDHLEFYNPIYFKHDWGIDDINWNRLLKGIFAKIKSDCDSFQCNEIEGEKSTSFSHVHPPVQVSENEAASPMIARASYGSTSPQSAPSALTGAEAAAGETSSPQQSIISTVYNSVTSLFRRFTEYYE